MKIDNTANGIYKEAMRLYNKGSDKDKERYIAITKRNMPLYEESIKHEGARADFAKELLKAAHKFLKKVTLKTQNNG